MKKIHIIISGIVTGVGYRWWIKMRAKEKSIYGWVKNKTDNEVEAVFFGNEKDVDDLIKLCEKGSALSKVKSIKIKDYKQKYFKKSFDILHD